MRPSVFVSTGAFAPTLPASWRLGSLLEALPDAEFRQLAARTNVEVDPSKRISPALQLARALAVRAPIRTLRGFDEPQRQVFYDLVRGLALRPEQLPVATELSRQGWLFTSRGETPERWALPIAYALQLPSWQDEDLFSTRLLLSQLLLSPPDASSVSTLVRYHAGSSAVAPWVLGLEEAYLALTHPERVAQLLTDLPPVEARVLADVCTLGGEVDAEQLVEIEREPLRLQRAGLVVHARRGVSHELTRRGLLVFMHPNRYRMPNDVRTALLAPEHERRAALRQALQAAVSAHEWTPERARFARDPVHFALRLCSAVQGKVAVREQVGTPRSLIATLARATAAPPEGVALFATLSRQLGLWAMPPPSTLHYPVEALGPALFQHWVTSRAWDEAGSEPETVRKPLHGREASPTRSLRVALWSVLRRFASRAWVPFSVLLEALAADPESIGLEARLERWNRRVGQAPRLLAEVAQRIVFESLFTLGAVDVGEEGSADPGARVLRVSARALNWVTDPEAPPSAPVTNQAHFGKAFELHVGLQTSLATLLAALPLLELEPQEQELCFTVSSSRIEGLVLQGWEADDLLGKLSALAKPPARVVNLIEQAVHCDARAEWVAASGFLWVDDPRVLARLAARKALAELFIQPSPAGGLLLREGVQIERLVRACRAVGVEVVSSGKRLRARAKLR